METDVARGFRVEEEIVPGLNVSTDAQILAAIKRNGIMTFHAAATCEYWLFIRPVYCLSLM